MVQASASRDSQQYIRLESRDAAKFRHGDETKGDERVEVIINSVGNYQSTDYRGVVLRRSGLCHPNIVIRCRHLTWDVFSIDFLGTFGC